MAGKQNSAIAFYRFPRKHRRKAVVIKLEIRKRKPPVFKPADKAFIRKIANRCFQVQIRYVCAKALFKALKRHR